MSGIISLDDLEVDSDEDIVEYEVYPRTEKLECM
jgi:hypothetical protein